MVQGEKASGMLGIHGQSDERKNSARSSLHSARLTPNTKRASTGRVQFSAKELEKMKQLQITGRRESQKPAVEKTSRKVSIAAPDEKKKSSLSKEDRARKKFSHSVYDKAAIMFELLSESKKNEIKAEKMPIFDTEFERRRAYSLAFAAKRYEEVLKDVLLDSSFYSSYFKLETFHHSKVMVMLLDFYEHSFRFCESRRHTVDTDNAHFLNHINDIQKAFSDHKIKLCSAFARNRIKACALTLEGLLPPEVKDSGECGARHPLYTRINTMITEKDDVLKQLEASGFVLKEELPNTNDNEDLDKWRSYCVDSQYDDLLIFPPEAKDEIFNHTLTLNYFIIPQSKPRHIVGEFTKNLLVNISETQQKAAKMIPGDVNFLTETGDILLTHAEAGSLSAHLDSFLSDNRKLIICGCDEEKADDLVKVLKGMHVGNVELFAENFIELLPNDDRLRSVKIIVCNPPCSKSGVVNLVDYVLYEGANAASSLTATVSPTKLRGFIDKQRMNLKHAFQFALVQSVIYCTSSVLSEENEELVDQVIREQVDDRNINLFSMNQISRNIIKTLHEECGLQDNDCKYLSMPATSLIDGFFVSLLERKVREETIREVMDRAAKTGLLKKGASKTTTKKKITTRNIKSAASITTSKEKKETTKIKGATSPNPNKSDAQQKKEGMKEDGSIDEGHFKF